MHLIKAHLSFFLKLMISIALIFWLLKQGKLDFSTISTSFKYKAFWLAAFLTALTSILGTTFRWKFLLKSWGKKIRLIDLVKIQWISVFFSTATPGGIAGDIIKIGYLGHISKKFLLISIFIERLIGLFSLILISAIVTGIFYSDLITLNSQFKVIAVVNFLLLIACIFFSTPFIHKFTFLDRMVVRFLNRKLALMLLVVFRQYRNNKIALLKSLFFSSVMHLNYTLIFWLVSRPFLDLSFDPKFLVPIVLLGNIATALPISLAGVGVGHVAFERLLSLAHQANGASLFSIFWILLVVIHLGGVLPYIFMTAGKK